MRDAPTCGRHRRGCCRAQPKRADAQGAHEAGAEINRFPLSILPISAETAHVRLWEVQTSLTPWCVADWLQPKTPVLNGASESGAAENTLTAVQQQCRCHLRDGSLAKQVPNDCATFTSKGSALQHRSCWPSCPNKAGRKEDFLHLLGARPEVCACHNMFGGSAPRWQRASACVRCSVLLAQEPGRLRLALRHFRSGASDVRPWIGLLF